MEQPPKRTSDKDTTITDASRGLLYRRVSRLFDFVLAEHKAEDTPISLAFLLLWATSFEEREQ